MSQQLTEPGFERCLWGKGFELLVQPEPNGALRITCPERPKLAVTSETVSDARALTREAIHEILVGRVRRRDEAR